MSRLTMRRGNVTITLDDGLHDLLDRTLRAARPKTIAAIERGVASIYRQAKASWPVGREREGTKEKGRPHSRDLLEMDVGADPTSGVVSGKIRIDTPGNYAVKIITDQNGINGNPWNILVRSRMKALTPMLARIMAREIAEQGAKK